jgi:hypothetical protein
LPAEARSAKVGGRDQLDTAIDRAVREMLDVEPPAGLRGRVLDRLDPSTRAVASASTRAVASAFRRKTAWITVPVAAAAVIVLAVLAPWRQPAPRVVAPGSPSIAKVNLPPTVPPATAPKSSESSKTVKMPRSRGAGERIIVAAGLPDDEASAIDPLSAIAPITVAPARPADIAPKEIAVSPLAPITELQIAPLSPPERRN